MELSCEKLKENLIKFPEKYHKDFDAFWVWKNEKESGGQSVLDDVILEATYVKLAKILVSWQTYRRSKNHDPLATLREALVNIKAYYPRKYQSLL